MVTNVNYKILYKKEVMFVFAHGNHTRCYHVKVKLFVMMFEIKLVFFVVTRQRTGLCVYWLLSSSSTWPCHSHFDLVFGKPRGYLQ